MSRYFTISINTGTSPGPYTIYYNTIGSGNIATIYPSGLPAENLTLSQLQSGVIVTAPVNIVDLFLYNVLCETNQKFQIPQIAVTYPDICITVQNVNLGINDQYQFTYSNNTINGKPQYQTYNGYLLNWNLNGYWEFITYPGPILIQSNDADNIPDSNWGAVGPSAKDYIITVQQGICTQIPLPSSLTLTRINPTCFLNINGSINAQANGGGGGWTYSLNGLLYNNTTGVFTSLSSGQYTIYAKDLNNQVISQTITLTSPQATIFSMIGTANVTNLPTVGNMRYYMVTVNYDTTQIPIGAYITFNYKMVYNLTYAEPGFATFDTTQHYVTKNGNQLTISSDVSTPYVMGQDRGCDVLIPLYLYSRLDSYISPTITLTNGDVFVANIIYGIDTTTNGSSFLNSNGTQICNTAGFVNINSLIENVISECDCCSYRSTNINIPGTSQNYES
jgi:hypothetical protein